MESAKTKSGFLHHPRSPSFLISTRAHVHTTMYTWSNTIKIKQENKTQSMKSHEQIKGQNNQFQFPQMKTTKFNAHEN